MLFLPELLPEFKKLRQKLRKSSGKAPEKLRQTQSNDYVNKISGPDTPFNVGSMMIFLLLLLWSNFILTSSINKMFRSD